MESRGLGRRSLGISENCSRYRYPRNLKPNTEFRDMWSVLKRDLKGFVEQVKDRCRVRS